MYFFVSKGATGCPHKPDNDLKDENLEEYCDKYKQNLECVFKKYVGCDKGRYAEHMESMVKGLRKKAKKIETLCELELDIPEEAPKKKKESAKESLRHNGQTTSKIPIVTGPPCKINTIATDCTKILTNVQFNPQWNGVSKQQW
jgi:hypothetical protein